MADIIEELIGIDPENDEKELASYFEQITNKKLYPAQDEKLLLSAISHQSSINKIAFANTQKQFFVRFANGIFLDLIGEFWSCPRLRADYAEDVLKVNLYETYSFEQILPKGSKVETKDGKYIFITQDDLMIPAGELTGIVKIKAELAGAQLNDYSSGEINALIENYEYIESVANINGASGGSDPEDDDAYKERLYLAPEKLSTAGTRKGYKYFALSAHKDIIDVNVDCPQYPAIIKIGDNIYEEKNGLITCEELDAIVDYNSGTVTVNIKNGLSFEVKIPPAATVEICALTKDGELAQPIIDSISKAVDTEDHRPLTDKIWIFGAEKDGFILNADITINKEADFEKVEKAVNTTINDYFDTLKQKLGIDVVKSELIAIIKRISGVYDVDISTPKETLKGSKTKFYEGTIGNLTFRRAT